MSDMISLRILLSFAISFAPSLFLNHSIYAQEYTVDTTSEQTANDSEIDCEGRTKTECLNKLKLRIAIARDFQENYDPRLYDFLAISSHYAKIVKNEPKLLENPQLRDKFYSALIKNLDNASIDYSSMNEYTMKVLDSLAEETLNLVGSAGKGWTQALPGAYRFLRTTYTEFPKMELADGDQIHKQTQRKRKTFEQLEYIQNNRQVFNLENPEIRNTFDIGFGAVFKRSINYTSEDLKSDPLVQVFEGTSMLFKYQNDKISFDINNAKQAILNKMKDLAEDTEAVLTENFKRVARATNDIKFNQKLFLYNQRELVVGVDYLTASEIKKSQIEKLATMTSAQIKEFIDDNKSCNTDSKKFSSNIQKQECIIHAEIVKDSGKSLLFNKRYEESRTIANETVGVIADLGILFKDKNLPKIAQDSQKVLNTVDQGIKAVKSFKKMADAAGAMASMASFMTGVGAITGALSAFSGGLGGGPDPAIMAKLDEIVKKLDLLKEEMNKRFDDLNTKLDSISEEINSSQLSQSQFTANAIVSLAKNVRKNSETLNEVSEKLNIVNENVLNNNYENFRKDFINAADDFKYSNDEIEATNNLTTLVARFLRLIEKSTDFVEPNYVSLTSYDNTYGVYSRLISEASSSGRISTHGKYKLLSLLSNLQSSTSDNQCRMRTLKVLRAINNEMNAFLEAINSKYNNNGVQIIDWALSNDFQTSVLLKDLDLVIDDINTVISASESCLNLKENDSANLVERLFNEYEDRFLEYNEEIRASVIDDGEDIQAQIFSYLTSDSNLLEEYKTHMNGLLPENKGSLSTDILKHIDYFQVFHDEEKLELKTNEYFENSSAFPKTIKSCYPNSEHNKSFDFQSLPFPKAFLNQSINSNYLKLALSTGLIKWNFCYEVQEANAESNTYDFLLQVRENGLGFNENREEPVVQDKLIATLPMKAPIAEKYREQALSGFQKTARRKTFKYNMTKFSDKPQPKYSDIKPEVSYVAECTEYRKEPETNISYSGSVLNTDEQWNNQRYSDSNNYNELLYTMYVTFDEVKCKRTNSVAKDIYTEAFVNSDKGWKETVNHNKICEDLYGTTLKRCDDKEFKKLAQKEYKDETKTLLESDDLEPSANESFTNLSLISSQDKDELLPAIIESGVKKFYQEFHTRTNSCYFQLLAGQSRCRMGDNNNEVVVSPFNSNDIQSIEALGQMLNYIPSIYFKPVKSEDYTANEAEQLLQAYLENLDSPQYTIHLAKDLSDQGLISRGVHDLMNEMIKNNLRHFEDKILPLLQSNFEFDDSLLIDRSQLQEIKNLKDRVSALKN